MIEKYNTFSFCRDDYTIPGEHYGDPPVVNNYELYKDISEFIRIALANGYQMKIWDDECTIVIEYNYKDEEMSGATLQWLGEDEYVETYQKEENESL